MKLKVLRESGYDEAALGFSLSYGSTIERAKTLFPSFAFKQGGENKFLESIYLWLDVRAPRYWWSEADTYRLTTKQSESTMHTIAKRQLNDDDFSMYWWGANIPYTQANDLIKMYQEASNPQHKPVLLEQIKASLPEGYLQRRIWVMNYKSLQNIIQQRKKHKLREWLLFCDMIMEQVEHPEFLDKNE